MSSFSELFNHPTPAYQGKPFWSWNGRLEKHELLRQLEVLRQMGMGGAFLHSRVGLSTEYLGEEWLALTEACVQECKRLGLEAWLYDEDRWPSGLAGGLVTRHKRHRLHLITMEVLPADAYARLKGETGLAGQLLGVWAGRVAAGHGTALRRVPAGARKFKPAAGETHVLLFKDCEQPHSDWYNGYTYLDTMSAAAVRAFLDVTHERYRKRLGKEFGKAVKGIFTDEPNFGWVTMGLNPLRHPEATLGVNNWTPRLPKVFKARYGYDLLDWLPALFLELDDPLARRARYHHRDCCTHLFVEHFAKQIGQWCGKHKLPLTGHILLEGDLRNQTMVVGACMPFYEHMQAPGIDILSEFAHEYDTAKQTASVLRQTGRTQMLSELYGCTGWDFPMRGHKAVGDWQLALGVNVRCHHLSWYTMRGEAKRDYPASIFFQSPWWEHYRHLEDYYSRCHVALTRGEPARRIAVVHPIESMWAAYTNPLLGPEEAKLDDGEFCFTERRAAIRELNGLLPKLSGMLLQGHLDFDYVDETMLPRLGRVRPGQRPTLRVGQAEYEVVVVGPQHTLRATTLRLLRRFVAAGGSVIFAGEPPALIDALPGEGARKLAAVATRVPFEAGALQAALAPWRDVSITTPDGAEAASVLYMLRREGDETVLFLCNTDRAAGHAALTVRVRARGKQAAELRPETGGAWQLAAEREGDWLRFETALAPVGSRLFAFGKLAKGAAPRPHFAPTGTLALGEPTATQRTEPNVLPLDFARCKLGDDKAFGERMEILKLDRAVRTRLGLPLRGGMMKQPWARADYGQEPGTPLALEFDFEVEALPTGAVELAHEFPDTAVLRLNGQALSTVASPGWWVDPCLRRLPLPAGALRRGRNVLTAELPFRASVDIEALYLLGDFGVVRRVAGAALTAAPALLRHGDWTEQGLPFYGAAVVYRYALPARPAPGERFVLQLGAWQGFMARVLVAGHAAGCIGWPPDELDLSCALAALPAGTTATPAAPLELVIELYGSRRNTFGPLHQVNTTPQWIGPDSFITTGEDWTDAYVTKPVGLLAAPHIRRERAQ